MGRGSPWPRAGHLNLTAPQPPPPPCRPAPAPGTPSRPLRPRPRLHSSLAGVYVGHVAVGTPPRRCTALSWGGPPDDLDPSRQSLHFNGPPVCRTAYNTASGVGTCGWRSGGKCGWRAMRFGGHGVWMAGGAWLGGRSGGLGHCIPLKRKALQRHRDPRPGGPHVGRIPKSGGQNKRLPSVVHAVHRRGHGRDVHQRNGGVEKPQEDAAGRRTGVLLRRWDAVGPGL